MIVCEEMDQVRRGKKNGQNQSGISVKEIVWGNFGIYAYSLFCRELDENIDINHTSIH